MFVIPIGDENPRERIPFVNYFLIAANIAVFFMMCMPMPSDEVVGKYALFPSNPQLMTLFTSMFLHAGFLHLAGNMLFLWIFGDNVEDKLGHFVYLCLYLAGGLAAAGAHLLTTSTPDIPVLGASGAVSFTLGAYIVFFPRHYIKLLVWFYIIVRTTLVSAIWGIGLWFAMQLLLALSGEAGVAYAAHIGGFVAGLIVAFFFKYLVIPGKLGVEAAPSRLPAELKSASRRSSRPTLSVREPITMRKTPAKPDSSGITFIDKSEGKFAVLRTSDELFNIGKIADATAELTGEKPSAVAERLKITRGMIAKGVSRNIAGRISSAMKRIGVNAAMVEVSPSAGPPASVYSLHFNWNDKTFSSAPKDASALAEDGKESRQAPVKWEVPFLYVAARVSDPYMTLIDIFVDPLQRLRIVENKTVLNSEVTPMVTINDLARSIVELRKGAAINDGIRTLATRGTWGYLSFNTMANYEDYCFYLFHVVRKTARTIHSQDAP